RQRDDRLLDAVAVHALEQGADAMEVVGQRRAETFRMHQLVALAPYAHQAVGGCGAIHQRRGDHMGVRVDPHGHAPWIRCQIVISRGSAHNGSTRSKYSRMYARPCSNSANPAAERHSSKSMKRVGSSPSWWPWIERQSGSSP